MYFSTFHTRQARDCPLAEFESVTYDFDCHHRDLQILNNSDRARTVFMHIETEGYDAVIDVNDWQREFEIVEVCIGDFSLMMWERVVEFVVSSLSFPIHDDVCLWSDDRWSTPTLMFSTFAGRTRQSVSSQRQMATLSRFSESVSKMYMRTMDTTFYAIIVQVYLDRSVDDNDMRFRALPVLQAFAIGCRPFSVANIAAIILFEWRHEPTRWKHRCVWHLFEMSFRLHHMIWHFIRSLIIWSLHPSKTNKTSYHSP